MIMAMIPENGLIANANQQYYASANVLNKSPTVVKVIVENTYDIPFWSHLLHTMEPQTSFQFSTCSSDPTLNSTTDGKDTILSLARQQHLGKNFIGCIDSDYDYLLETITPHGQQIANCQFLVQTLVYSIENYMVCPNGLEQVCINACKQNVQFDFLQAFRDLSLIIYPLFVKSVFLESIDDHRDFKGTDWGRVLVKRRTIMNASFAEILNDVHQQVNQFITVIDQRHAQDGQAIRTIEQMLRDKYGVNPDNCLLYVRGHDLYDFVLDVLVKPLVKTTVDTQRRMLSQKFQGDTLKGRMNDYNKQVKADPKVYLDTNDVYLSSYPQLMQKIRCRLHVAIA